MRKADEPQRPPAMRPSARAAHTLSAINLFAALLRKDNETLSLNIGRPPPKFGAPATTHAASTAAHASPPMSVGGRHADVGCLAGPGMPAAGRRRGGGGRALLPPPPPCCC